MPFVFSVLEKGYPNSCSRRDIWALELAWSVVCPFMVYLSEEWGTWRYPALRLFFWLSSFVATL